MMLYAVICVDDDPMILQMLDFQLRKHITNEKVLFEFYTNPIEALESIGRMEELGVLPVVLITDFQMPEMNGADFIRAVKERIRSIHTIMLSGQANAIQVDDLVNDELLDVYLYKPWDEMNLIQKTTALLERKNIFI
jgi:CheY-like chemotaxis protein